MHDLGSFVDVRNIITDLLESEGYPLLNLGVFQHFLANVPSHLGADVASEVCLHFEVVRIRAEVEISATQRRIEDIIDDLLPDGWKFVVDNVLAVFCVIRRLSTAKVRS